MEAVILKDVMACLTLVQRGKLDKEMLDFTEEGAKKGMRKKLDDVEAPIHPGKVFRMVAGTSTGALMAFGLLHGKGGERMTLEEIVSMYEEHTATIFPSWLRSFRSWLRSFRLWRLTPFNWPGSPLPIPLGFYSQDGLKKVLEKIFENRSLSSVRDESSIAAAVARRQNPPEPPGLDIFDTHSTKCDGTPLSHSLVEVLKASTCAPVYFKAPTSIGEVDYIDGGVGGNCPLAQAIPRMKEIDKDDYLQTVLSISPPGETDTNEKKWWKEWLYWGVPLLESLSWLPWFCKQLPNGYPVYCDQQRANPDAIFLRLSPQSKETKAFRMDSWDIKGMKESVRSESLADPAYFTNIILAALLLSPSVDLTACQNHKSLMKKVEKILTQNEDKLKLIMAWEKIYGPESWNRPGPMNLRRSRRDWGGER